MSISSSQYPVILTIAGFDPGSGAGITANIKTIAAHGCFGVACITALTVQTTQGVTRVEPVAGKLIQETLNELAADFPVAAVHVGMLAGSEAAASLADFLDKHDCGPVVIDPVLRSSSGAVLLGEAGVEVLKTRLLPLATVITPNLEEAAALTGQTVETADQVSAAGRRLLEMGAKNVVITGGHSANKDNTDLVFMPDRPDERISGERIESRATHGTGCAYSSALACHLALGRDLITAAKLAKEYVRQAIQHAYPLGKGAGPVNHLFRLE